MITWWWVRGTFFTCGIATDENGVIVQTAPVLKRFRGQHWNRLMKWQHVLEVRKI